MANRLTYIDVRILMGKITAAAALTITDGDNATPIVLTSEAHGLLTGDTVAVYGVAGLTAANGAWAVTKVDADTFSLDGSVGNSNYTSGGSAKKLTCGLTVDDLLGLQDAVNRTKAAPTAVVNTLLSGLTTL